MSALALSSEGRPRSAEHLLVFYIPGRVGREDRCERMLAAGLEALTSHNSY